MPKFSYRGVNSEGETLSGVVTADDDSQAISAVELQGLLPLDVKEERSEKKRRIFGKKMKGEELILITRQLHTLLESGIPLVTCIQTLARQTQNKNLREALEDVRNNVQMGRTFSESLAVHRRMFSELYVSIVRAGEESGLLVDMLDRLSILLEYEADTRSRVKSATMYPMMVIGELCLAFVVIVKVVLPRFTALFAEGGVALPLPTRVLMAISKFTESNWYVIVACVIALSVGFGAFSRTKKGRLAIDKTRIRVPIMGPIILKSMLSRFSRILAALITSGFPIIRSLEIVGNTAGNVAILNEIDKIKAQIIRGMGLAEPLEASSVFPPMMSRMIAIGEETGSLDKMLVKVANYYDREVDYSIKNLTTILEPILIVVLGCSVLFVALAVFLPMWNMMSAMKR